VKSALLLLWISHAQMNVIYGAHHNAQSKFACATARVFVLVGNSTSQRGADNICGYTAPCPQFCVSQVFCSQPACEIQIVDCWDETWSRVSFRLQTPFLGDIAERFRLLRSMLPFRGLSVCLCGTFVHCVQTAEDIDTFSFAYEYDNPIHVSPRSC